VQTQGGAAAEAAILSKERHFTSDVRVDWAGDGSFSGPLFNLSPFIRDIAVNRALEGQLPPEVNLTEGSAAAELTFTLKNARDPESGLRLIQCLSTLNSKSPLAGKDLVGAEITWDIWVDTPTGPVKYRQFIGNIRTIQPNRVDGTIQITALDRVEKLRHPVTLPPWAYSHQAASVDGRFEGQLQNPQGVIDAALRGNGADGHPTSPTPYSPTAYDWLRREDYFGAGVSSGGCHFWLTGTSSVPVLGYCDEPHRSTYYPTETTGIQMFDHLGAVHPDSPDPGIVPLSIKAKGSTNRSNIYYRVPDSAAVHEWGNHYLGFTLITRDTDFWKSSTERLVMVVEIEGGIEIRALISSGQVYTQWRRVAQSGVTEVTRESQRIDIPTGKDWVRVNLRWNCVTNDNRLYGTLRVDDFTTGDHYIHVRPAKGPNRGSRGRIMVRDEVGLQDVYYYSYPVNTYTGEYLGVVNRLATYAAVLDPGLHRLSHFPTVKEQEAWELIKEVAAAEFGAAFWDENGVFRFWNRNTLKNKRVNPVRTVTADELGDLSVTFSNDSLRNVITVPQHKTVASAWRSIHEATDNAEFQVSPNTRKHFWIENDDIIASDDGQVRRYATSGTVNPRWNQYVKHGYVAQWYTQTGGSGPVFWQEDNAKASGVDVFSKFERGKLHIEIWNGYDQSVRFTTNDSNFKASDPGWHPNEGEAALRIGGSMKVTYDPEIKTYKDSSTFVQYGQRMLEINSPWIQFGNPNSNFTDYLLPRVSQVVPVADQDVVMPGDPRIQLGDTLLVKDADGIGEEFKMQITGITRSYSADRGLEDSYVVELFMN